MRRTSPQHPTIISATCFVACSWLPTLFHGFAIPRTHKGCRIVLGFFLPQVLEFLFGFLSQCHLPCVCNSFELEPVILHGICYVLAWSLCILHGVCYIWPCSPSILHGICHILAFQPLICMVFATFWCFKRSCGSLEGSLGFHLGFHLRFHLGFHLGFYLGYYLGFHLGFL